MCLFVTKLETPSCTTEDKIIASADYILAWQNRVYFKDVPSFLTWLDRQIAYDIFQLNCCSPPYIINATEDWLLFQNCCRLGTISTCSGRKCNATLNLCTVPHSSIHAVIIIIFSLHEFVSGKSAQIILIQTLSWDRQCFTFF